jgi:RNA polymerase sigma-B factor
MTLMRNGVLLETVLIPWLVAVSSVRAPTVWIVGCAEDALAVAIVYMHVKGPRSRHDLRIFLSGRRRPLDEVQIRASELVHFVAAGHLDAAAMQSVRWMPSRDVMESVVLGEPEGPVDLLVVNPSRLAALSIEMPGQRVRQGGLLILAGDRVRDQTVLTGFRPVDESKGVWERLEDITSSNHPAQALPGKNPSTLARKQMEASLVRSHLGLASSLARRYANRGEPIDDLQQVAYLALVKAASRYDELHGEAFHTFAISTILGELKRHFRDKTWTMRPPRSLQERYLALREAWEELSQTEGRSPTVAQIARHLRSTEEEVLEAMEAERRSWPASLDTQRLDCDDAGIQVGAIDPGFDGSLNTRMLQQLLPVLSPVEQLLIKRVYFDGYVQREVADELGVSQMQVSRMLAKALAKLRRAFTADADDCPAGRAPASTVPGATRR